MPVGQVSVASKNVMHDSLPLYAVVCVCVCARTRVCVCVCVCKVTLPEKVCGVTKCVTPLFFSSSPVLLHLFSIPSSPYVSLPSPLLLQLT